MARFLIVVARFYEDIAEALVTGARADITGAGHACELVEVPGALEIPAAIAMAEETGRYDGYVALGCVIRGKTSHYDTVCAESARGLNDLAIYGGLAIGNGILTVENDAQALERALPDEHNKGAGAARACLCMYRLKQRLGGAEG